MSRKMVISDDALLDIDDLATYIARDSPESSIRFRAAVVKAFDQLQPTPGGGSPKPAVQKRLAGLRSWRIKGFPKHLVLYLCGRGDIRVLAVIHGARDLRRALRRRK